MQRTISTIDSLQSAADHFCANNLAEDLSSLASFADESLVVQSNGPYGESEMVNDLLWRMYWKYADIPEYENIERWFASHVLKLGTSFGEECLVQAATNALFIMQEFADDFPQAECIQASRLPPRLLALYKYRKAGRPVWEIRRLVALSAVLRLSPAELCLSIDPELPAGMYRDFLTLRWETEMVLPHAVGVLHTGCLTPQMVEEYQSCAQHLAKPAT